jgi:hypothetical protein
MIKYGMLMLLSLFIGNCTSMEVETENDRQVRHIYASLERRLIPILTDEDARIILQCLKSEFYNDGSRSMIEKHLLFLNIFLACVGKSSEYTQEAINKRLEKMSINWLSTNNQRAELDTLLSGKVNRLPQESSLKDSILEVIALLQQDTHLQLPSETMYAYSTSDEIGWLLTARFSTKVEKAVKTEIVNFLVTLYNECDDYRNIRNLTRELDVKKDGIGAKLRTLFRSTEKKACREITYDSQVPLVSTIAQLLSILDNEAVELVLYLCKGSRIQAATMIEFMVKISTHTPFQKIVHPASPLLINEITHLLATGLSAIESSKLVSLSRYIHSLITTIPQGPIKQSLLDILQALHNRTRITPVKREREELSATEYNTVLHDHVGPVDARTSQQEVDEFLTMPDENLDGAILDFINSADGQTFETLCGLVLQNLHDRKKELEEKKQQRATLEQKIEEESTRTPLYAQQMQEQQPEYEKLKSELKNKITRLVTLDEKTDI